MNKSVSVFAFALFLAVCNAAAAAVEAFKPPCLNGSCSEECPLTRHPFVKAGSAEDRKVLLTAVKTYTAAGKPSIALMAAIHVGTMEYFRRHQEIVDKKGFVLYEMPYDYVDDGSCRQLLTAHALEAQLSLGLMYQYQVMEYRSRFLRADVVNREATKGQLEEQYEDMSSKSVCDATIKKLLEKTPYCREINPDNPLLCHVMSTSQFFRTNASLEDQNRVRMEMIEDAHRMSQVDGFGKLWNFVIVERETHVKDMVRGILRSKILNGWKYWLSRILPGFTGSDIAILYGADHMERLEWFICEEFGYRLQSEEWIEAFSVSKNFSLK